MISYSELNEQIHRITELSNILRYLFNDRSMCDTRTCCDLLNNYVNLVNNHFEFVEKTIYRDLLRNPNKKANTLANNFMSGSVEVKRIIKTFSKQWCATMVNDSLKIKDHPKFLNDTQEMFDLVLKRIQDEVEHLYPMVRNLQRAS